MSKVWLKHGLRLATLAVLGLSLAAATADAGPRPGARRRALNLFAGTLSRENVNRWDCGLNAFGQTCVDPNGSTTVPGGFWPKGTADAYVFLSGLQLAGIIDTTMTKAQFSWASDTVGAFFFDPKGTTEHGDKLSLLWNSLNSSDAANWPRDAFVPNDTSLYDPVLIGRVAASQQDNWQRVWDGNPAFNAGRLHPLGVLVDIRGMGWNFPTGNEDIMYFVYTFTNVSSKTAATYAGRPDADSLLILGTRFQQLNEGAFGVQIPDTGYTIQALYAAFAMDADVSAAARENYSTAFLPFNMGMAFKKNWYAPEMSFPASIFGAPFAAAPGIVGVKYLKSPINPQTNQEVGLTLFSNTINGGQFDDAQNTTQLWRYLSARLNPAAGDAPCNYPGVPLQTHVCYVTQNSDDIRFFQSSGPLSLKPGESQTIVVAYIAAAPVDVPAIAGRGPALDLKAGFPAQPRALALYPGPGGDTLRSVDRVFGALGVKDSVIQDSIIEQNEVRTVPRSLLNKGLVAQAVFDAHFLLPFPPDAPDFFMVPGDNQVTVVWKPSPTETIGDPYFAVASNPASPIYDPNYRQFDVEGYRVYRGRTTGDIALVAQFDYGSTAILDFTGTFNYGNCAPELGINTDCPSDLATGHAQSLSGDVVQIPAGGRVELANGDVLILQADTAVTGNASGNLALRDNGVPFVFVDNAVRNGFQYYYAVTAFDVNSVSSVGAGNTALESPRVAKSVTPRKSSGQQSAGNPGTVSLIGGDGSTLTGTMPTLDPATGIFSGPMPPTNGLDFGLAAFLPEVLGQGTVQIQIDSIVPGVGTVDYTSFPSTYYFTVLSTPTPVHVAVPFQSDCCDVAVTTSDANFPAAPAATAKASVFGGDSTFLLQGRAAFSAPGAWRNVSWGRGSANDAPTGSDFNGPRWWAGAPNENTNDPNGLQCSPGVGTCVQANLARNSGALPGVQVLFHPNSYLTVPNFPMRDFEPIGGVVSRAADFKLYWGTNGAVDSVVDVTHKVHVDYSPAIRASYGFLTDSSFVGMGVNQAPDSNNAILSWKDIFCVEPGPTYIGDYCQGATTAVLQDHARSTPVSAVSDGFDNPGGNAVTASTGNGFILYLNGHFFLMQLTGGTLPAAGTVWNARFYSGTVVGTVGNYTFTSELRPAAVPGLRAQFTFQGGLFDPTTIAKGALDRVHTVPDPYYVTNAFEQSPSSKKLRFVGLPARAIVRIYSLSGVLVNVLTLDDPTGGGELEWNLRNRNNQFVASGVYFYHVEAPDGQTKIGKLTVVNFAQ